MEFRDATGAPTTEYRDYQLSLFPLRKLFGGLPAQKFGPVALEQVREFMIRHGSGKEGKTKDGRQVNRRVGKRLCRRVVNQRVARILRYFKWAARKELIPTATYQALLTVDGLREGRTTARESADVLPVDDGIVDKTLPHLTPHVQAMVRVQRLTGARPGEVCTMRGADIDQAGPVWVYRPRRHKTGYKGKKPAIPIGPHAQAILKAFLKDDPEAFLFSPRECVQEIRLAKRATRKTKVQPSQINRAKANPERAPGVRYTVDAYGKAIRKACAREGIPQWHPHQLRHTAGTEIRRKHGVEAAQTVLGHARLSSTEIYAESDLAEAMKIAGQMG
jgi:integrase